MTAETVRVQKRAAVEGEMRKWLDRDGYGPDGVRYVSDEDMPHCENCRTISFSLMPLPGDEDVKACPKCCAEALELQEPECTCGQSDVDLFDARGCDLHDASSHWNTIRRAITSVQEYECAMDREVA